MHWRWISATLSIREAARSLFPPPRRTLCFVAVSLWAGVHVAPEALLAELPREQFALLDSEYRQQIRPMMQRFCLNCHSSASPAGDLDLERFVALEEVRRDTKAWVKVAEMLRNGEMPPEGMEQPTPEQRNQLRGWVERYLHAEALANAGDPGAVGLRRLNNAEYTYTIRDLTGVTLNPAREFPIDSAAGEGFTNASNALAMSPALFKKYLDAAKGIAQHAVLLPEGFRFSPHATRRDWTDDCVAQIRAFYEQFVPSVETPQGRGGALPLEAYFAAALAERQSLSTGRTNLAAVARKQGLNSKYFNLLWAALVSGKSSILLDDLRSRWRTARPGDAPALAAEVAAWQKGLWVYNPVGLIGKKGSRPQWLEPVSPVGASHELRFNFPPLQKGELAKEVVVSLVAARLDDGKEPRAIVWQRPRLAAEGRPDVILRDIAAPADVAPAKFGWRPDGRQIDSASLWMSAPSVSVFRLPAELAAGRELVATALLDDADAEGSVQVEIAEGVAKARPELQPNAVSVALSKINIGADVRIVTHLRPILAGDRSAAKKQLETAMEDHRRLFPPGVCYTKIVPADETLTLNLLYREDHHLTRLMLDATQQTRLDELWKQLLYVSQDALRTVDVLESLLETTIKHPQEGVFDSAVAPIQKRAATFRQELLASEPRHLDGLVAFAERAYRRPLAVEEKSELRGLYGRLRKQELTHDDAFRLTLARVFTAAPFLYRLETAPTGPFAAEVAPLELASRLSYFLWSSQPDEMLRKSAESGRLARGNEPARMRLKNGSTSVSHPNVTELQRHTRRMLKDPRVRRLAVEFGCQWLHIQDFDSGETKSEKLFPEFAGLRGEMFEEAVRFLTDLFERDGSLLSLLDAGHTFVNGHLAKFYGLEVPGVPEWRRVEGIQQYGRGGILGFSATLARQSGASRTSPILRGNWISEVLLGEKLPRPPKNVPQLADEVPEGLTERQLIERHRSDAACAKCHDRIDPLGFALEGFDAIGRRRERDAAGLPIDSRTTLPDGSVVEGLAGLRTYLREKRCDAFIRQFCRKLFGYALGRELQLSDEPLLAEMQQRLRRNNYRVSTAVEAIVLSPQFRKIRKSE
ncbi:MAG: DUF1588 domain-containing protein [Acidimicrobiia bacterium]|nr:DUF1588 domain-containing protein [Acidimicrobiia bacterium]